MSTRSGKRLHTSPEVKLKVKEVKTERKTRSQKQKENCIDVGVSEKKHYVLRYPSEEEASNDISSQIALRTRKSRRTTLKEVTNNDVDIPKHNKSTRRKKTVDKDAVPNLSLKTIKKSKKKKSGKNNALENGTKSVIEAGKKGVKKKISSGSVVIEDLNDGNLQNNSTLKNDISVDSFHSAAGSEHGSPEVNLGNKYKLKTSIIHENSLNKEYIECTTNCKQATVEKENNKKRKCKVKSLCKDEHIQKESMDIEILEEKDSYNAEENCHNSSFNVLFGNNRKSRASYKNSTFTEISTDNIQKPLSLIVNQNKSITINNEYTDNSDTELPKYNSSQSNTNDNIQQYESSLEKNNQDQTINTTFEMQTIHINTTYDKNANSINEENKKCNNISPVTKLTVNNSTKKKSSVPNTPLRNSLHVTETSNIIQSGTINVTYEKEDEDCTFKKLHESPSIQTCSTNTQVKLDTTFEKEPPNLNSTIDKAEDVSHSSLISSDSSIINEKSISRISITSDESNANIINTTPVIVESSLDEAQITCKSSPMDGKEPVKSPPSDCVVPELTPTTPLQREGTFTKESPTNLTSPIRLSTSPGRTPFPSSKRTSSKKAVLNITQSIEKIPKPCFAELPHTTKVMFCSPINTPMITNQVKGKVIKSSLKGSNKSFVFNYQEPCRLGSVRKRSYTESESKDNDVKRQRLGVGMTNSESRSRTSSASGKIQNTPTKLTPSKCKSEMSRVSRKKLPNFAALHQKQFDKMESLDECQERKARRAQMLAAGTSIATWNRDSKVDTKLSEKNNSLLSMNPGYTRFGFKMKSDVNPFSTDCHNMTSDSKISLNTTNAFANSTLSKKCVKSKELPNSLKRHTTLPSLNGSTARKEIAKQTIMREKSSADKRNASRNENRTIIKGVRTNRRFDLQMQMRNLKE